VLDSAVGRDDLRITFDDGNASDVEHALPALRERGLRATFFVVAGRLGKPGYLAASDVRALADAGMGIGSHGMRHVPWRGLDDAALRDELVDAKLLLEEVVERPVAEAACPFGSYDRRVLGMLRRSGYVAVYTSDRGASHPGDWIQPRNTVHHSDTGSVLAEIYRAKPRSRSAVQHAKRIVKRWR
jgi:peptidoglycan/xylan/chitin deacetylase (PgdA/CDA1 family)